MKEGGKDGKNKRKVRKTIKLHESWKKGKEG